MMVLRQQAASAGPARMDFRVGDSVDSAGSVRAVALVLALALAPTMLLPVDRVSATLRETSPRR
jgi:hypothetical protein